MTFEVIVPTYQGDKYAHAITSILLSQDVPFRLSNQQMYAHPASFAKNCNTAAKLSKADILLFLNSDTYPLPCSLEHLANVAYNNQRPTTPKIVFSESKMIRDTIPVRQMTVQCAGVTFGRMGNSVIPIERERGASILSPQSNMNGLVMGFSGCCFAIPKHMFINIGLFDADYKNGWEDNDLCLKLLEKDVPTEYVPEAVIFHACSSSPTRFDKEDANVARYNTLWNDTGRALNILETARRKFQFLP